jgi:hypothetical protein
MTAVSGTQSEPSLPLSLVLAAVAAEFFVAGDRLFGGKSIQMLVAR